MELRTYSEADLELFRTFFVILTIKSACLFTFIVIALRQYVTAETDVHLLKSIGYMALMTAMFFFLTLLYEPPWN